MAFLGHYHRLKKSFKPLNSVITERKNKKTTAKQWFFVENIGVEPMTFWLPAKRSSQLS